jgi:hypothetical protein
MTGNEITYTIINILTRFGFTDDSRLDPDQIAFLRDNVRSQLIHAEYNQTKVVDNAWMQDLGFLNLTPVNFNDDNSIPFCECIVSKVTLPDNISLYNPQSSSDSGLKLISSCGTRQFYYYPIELLAQIPKEHVRNKFYYYYKIGNAYYINKQMDKVRAIMVLNRPKDAAIINTEFVSSGSLVVGTSYTVYEAQVVHNGLGYNPGQTFTAVNANYTGLGKVKTTSRTSAYTEDSQYPVQGDMARQIILEILTKEFAIEETKITDVKNSSEDDEQERKKAITP